MNGAPVLDEGKVVGVLVLLDALSFDSKVPVGEIMRVDFPRLKTTDPVEAGGRVSPWLI